MCVPAGYRVLAADMPSRHPWVVAVFYWYLPHFKFEYFRPHGRNMMSFQMDSDKRRWFIVGCYLSPYNASNIERVITNIINSTHRAELLVDGNSNIDLAVPEGNCFREEIAVVIATAGLEDMSMHFLLHLKSWAWYRRTWCMHLYRREVRSQMNYLLGTDCHMFHNVSIRNSWHNYQHYMVLGRLHSAQQ